MAKYGTLPLLFLSRSDALNAFNMAKKLALHLRKVTLGRKVCTITLLDSVGSSRGVQV